MSYDAPILTVGMPVYNGEKYVRQAVESLLAQDYRNFVLIISDNASIDDTSQIISELADRDPRIRYLRQEKNIGAIANFRVVLDACETEYFCWAAADDYWSHDWLNKVMETAITEHCLAFGVIETVDENGNRLRHPADHRKLQFAGSRLFRRVVYFLSPGLLGKANPIYGVFRKLDFTEAVWGSFSTASYGSDVAALHQLLDSIPILSRADAVMFKRRHKENASQVQQHPKKRKPPFRKTMLLVFLAQSRFIERGVLLLLYPLAALGSIYAKALYLAFRVSRLRRRTGR